LWCKEKAIAIVVVANGVVHLQFKTGEGQRPLWENMLLRLKVGEIIDNLQQL
jgi:hypothetical protein